MSGVSAPRPHMRQPGLDEADEAHPTMAAHERGRKMKQNSNRGNPVASLLGKRKTVQSNVPIEKRLAEFPNQSLMRDSIRGNIFCRCCKQGDIQNIKGTISTHLRSPAHQDALEQWLTKRATDGEVKVFLADYFKQHPAEKMASLDDDKLLFRFNVMETVLPAGIAPEKFAVLSGILSEDIPASHMTQFVPKIEAFEFQRLRAEIKDQKVTVIYDGTTRLGECIVLLLRWCPSDFSGIQMRLVTVATTEAHMDGAELCAFINNVLVNVCQIESIHVVGGSRDSCSTNGTAMRRLQMVIIELQDFLCVSHTLSKFGEHVELPTLYAFMTHWLGLVQLHPSAKRLWSEMTGGKAMQGYSTIRWCSREVVQNELAVKLGTHVPDFVDTLIEREIGDAHPKKMRTILDSHMDTLQLELAVSLDLERIINTVHRMEGDGLVVLLAYDEIDALLRFGNSAGDTPNNLPNLARLLRDKVQLANGAKVYEFFEGLGWFEGKITSINVAADKYTVKHSDGSTITQSGNELRQWLDIRGHREWTRLVTEVKKGFTYLQGRLDGSCNNINYDCSAMWEVLRLLTLPLPVQVLRWPWPETWSRSSRYARWEMNS